MSLQEENEPVPLSHIHIDIREQSITFIGQDQRAIRFIWNPQILLEQLASTPEESTPEKDPLETFSGKLKSKPTEGYPDRKGHPTATAKMAVHQEGEARARMFFATFHGATREVALTLPAEAPITVQGYPHSADREGRLDTLSVMKLIRYPGKQQSRGNGS